MFTRATTYNIIDRTYHDGGGKLDSVFIRNILMEAARYGDASAAATLASFGSEGKRFSRETQGSRQDFCC